MHIYLKRAYDQPKLTDGKRILVDRLWPRGLTKEDAAIDLWAKDIAPSSELRKWFSHDPAKWEEFQVRYRQELDSMPSIVKQFKTELTGDVTFIYGAKDTEHTHALVLKRYFES